VLLEGLEVVFVPENWMKFALGVMLTSFGTLRGAEGAGVAWPANT